MNGDTYIPIPINKAFPYRQSIGLPYLESDSKEISGRNGKLSNTVTDKQVMGAIKTYHVTDLT